MASDRSAREQPHTAQQRTAQRIVLFASTWLVGTVAAGSIGWALVAQVTDQVSPSTYPLVAQSDSADTTLPGVRRSAVGSALLITSGQETLQWETVRPLDTSVEPGTALATPSADSRPASLVSSPVSSSAVLSSPVGPTSPSPLSKKDGWVSVPASVVENVVAHEGRIPNAAPVTRVGTNAAQRSVPTASVNGTAQPLGEGSPRSSLLSSSLPTQAGGAGSTASVGPEQVSTPASAEKPGPTIAAGKVSTPTTVASSIGIIPGPSPSAAPASTMNVSSSVPLGPSVSATVPTVGTPPSSSTALPASTALPVSTASPQTVTSAPAPVTTASPAPATTTSTVVNVVTSTSITPSVTTAVLPISAAYNTRYGSVGVHCAGRSIVLDFATPAAGATVTVANRGPEEVEVAFRKDGNDTEVHARCVNGAPQQAGASDRVDQAQP